MFQEALPKNPQKYPGRGFASLGVKGAQRQGPPKKTAQGFGLPPTVEQLLHGHPFRLEKAALKRPGQSPELVRGRDSLEAQQAHGQSEEGWPGWAGEFRDPAAGLPEDQGKAGGNVQVRSGAAAPEQGE